MSKARGEIVQTVFINTIIVSLAQPRMTEKCFLTLKWCFNIIPVLKRSGHHCCQNINLIISKVKGIPLNYAMHTEKRFKNSEAVMPNRSQHNSNQCQWE